MTHGSRDNIPWWQRPAVLVPALLTVFAALAVHSLRQESAVYDETAHIPAGVTYVQRSDFRLNPEHPPLAKIWAALPLWAFGIVEPDYDSPYWQGTAAPAVGGARTAADQWRFGFETLNGPIRDSRRRNPAPALDAARSMVVGLGVVLGLVVFAWSRALWGNGGGLLSLSLFTLSPTMLAHSRLVTTDLPAALGFALTCWCLWRFTRRPGWARAIVTGLALGAALLMKFSALLMIPIGCVLVVAARFDSSRTTDRPALPRAPRLAAMALAAGLAAYVTVWAGYGFHGPAAADPGYRLDWSGMKSEPSPAKRAILAARSTGMLPEAYLFGLGHFVGGSERRLAFLNGEQSITGWWYYFPEAFVLKTPPALLVLAAWTVAAAMGRRRWRSTTAWFLAVPVLVYVGVSIASNLNIGHRHLAPVYPFLFVAVGSAVPLTRASRTGRIALAALVAGFAVSSAAAAPDYLSYFNRLAGGMEGGWRYLVDSNTDWGQDLRRLSTWMEREGREQVFLAYFGTADPYAEGVNHRKVLLVHDFRPWQPAARPDSGDLLAVSVTLLQGVYVDRDREFAKAVVDARRVPMATVREWLALRDRRSLAEQRYPDLPEWLVQTGHLTAAERERYERDLLSTWLREVRDDLEPVGRAGGSIRIYRMP